MIRIVSAVLIVVVGFGTPVSAQIAPPDSAKSTSTAINYSVMGTLLPAALGGWLVIEGARGMGANEGKVALGIAIGSLGLIFGPGLGHAYAESPRPMKRTWTRTAGVAIAGLGFASMGFSDAYGNDSPAGVYLMMAVGGGMYLYGAVRDISELDDSVDRYNRQHGYTGVRLSPVYFVHSDAVGLAVSIAL